ncbi:MAG TPA: hypothetical protein VJH92_00860 [Candidatus Nanoarchaeia archaeon]|nr:hypothetical protein [Candidatus Nanoarchaeia archaeon]
MDAENGKRILIVRDYVMKNMKDLPYHNFKHAEDVARVSRELAIKEGINSEGIFLLETAGYIHDIISEVGRKDNEERSIERGEYFLPTMGYTPSQVYRVKSLVMATKLPTNPKNLLERIICDADLDNLGREDFFEKNEALRQEFGITDKKSWYQDSVNFLEGHNYYTRAARRYRGQMKSYNLAQLKQRITKYENS